MFDVSALTEQWTEDPAGICDNAGEVGGDIQDSESYSRRFARKIGNEYAVLDFYVYWAKEDPDTMRDARPDRWIQTSVWYTVCTDPNDPGSSEAYSDTRYWDSAPDDEMYTPRAHCCGLTREDISEAVNQMAN